MFDLILLSTMVLVSANHPNLESCQNAIREIYIQKIDPQKVIPTESLKVVLDAKMKYTAPREFKCLKKG